MDASNPGSNPTGYSPPTAPRRQLRGFSLTETIFTLSIGGLIAGFAVPAVYEAVLDARIITTTNALMADLHYARSEAIKRNQAVVLCRSEDGQQCSQSPGYRTDWSVGWIVFVNENDDHARDPSEPLIRAQATTKPDTSVTFNQRWRVTYRPTGRAKSGSFTVCDRRGPNHGRSVVLYFSGRPRVAKQKPDGGTLDCG